MEHSDILTDKRRMCLLFFVFCTVCSQKTSYDGPDYILSEAECTITSMSTSQVVRRCIHGLCRRNEDLSTGCFCDVGWGGRWCESPCLKDCKFGGFCVIRNNQETCDCVKGYSSESNCTALILYDYCNTTSTCAYEENVCLRGICKLDSDCMPTCVCPIGYVGIICQTLRNTEHECPYMCKPNPCRLDEKCGIAENNSVCYKPLNEDFRAMKPIKCVHGYCRSKEGKFWCECSENWTGDDCTTPCVKNCHAGQCVVIDGMETCRCLGNSDSESDCTHRLLVTEDGFCRRNVCSSIDMKCLNGGTCRVNENCAFECECLPDFLGRQCQIPKDLIHECPNSCAGTCHPSEICNIDGGTIECYQPTLNRSRRTLQVRCVHGQCKRQETGEFTCHCDDQMAGESCDIPCEKNCNQGQCIVSRGEELCTCHGFFTLESDCRRELRPHLSMDTLYKNCHKNVCKSNQTTCFNGGICKLNANCIFFCECPPGFRGYRCQISNITKRCPDDCKFNDPCHADEECHLNLTTFDISCMKIYKPFYSRPVFPVRCIHGQCEISDGFEYKCRCDEQWGGSTCETRCLKNCNNGVCIILDGHEYCKCEPDFTRVSNCTEQRNLNVEEKHGIPCKKNCYHGRCIIVRKKETCRCSPSRYTQESNCKRLRKCSKNICRYDTICLNGGTCKLDKRCAFKCKCPSGFKGRRCESPKKTFKLCPNWCIPGLCKWYERCHFDQTTYIVRCFERYNPSISRRITPMACKPTGHCIAEKGEFTCKCKDGWAGEDCGRRCNKKCPRGRCTIIDGKTACQCFGPYNIEIHCDILESRDKRCPNKCVPNPCIPDEACQLDPATYTISCVKHAYPYVRRKLIWVSCVHGECIKTKSSQFYCRCYRKWAGEACDISCTRNCHHGKCLLTSEEEEICRCRYPFTPESNCTEANLCQRNCHHGRCVMKEGKQTCSCGYRYTLQSNCKLKLRYGLTEDERPTYEEVN